MLLCALAAPLIAPHDPNEQDYLALTDPPSAAHLLGTDDLGRDVLSRLIYGSRVSLEVGLIAVGIAVGVGVGLGLSAGYTGGGVDDVTMRAVDAVQAFPNLILALAITAALGPSIGNAMLAIGFVATAWYRAAHPRTNTLGARARVRCRGARVWRHTTGHHASAYLAQRDGANCRSSNTAHGHRDCHRSSVVISGSRSPTANPELGRDVAGPATRVSGGRSVDRDHIRSGQSSSLVLAFNFVGDRA